MEDVQDPGHVPTPDEIGRKLDALAIREAEATRIALECRVERAKLLRQVQDEYGLKGKRYVEFAQVHHISSRTDAFDLLLLTEAGADVLEPSDDPYHEYPSWREVWRDIKNHHKEIEDRHWITPQETAEIVREEIGGNYVDICPHPRPEGYDALEAEWPDLGYLNAPFIRRNELKGRGLTAWVTKAIEEGKNKTIAVVLPVRRIIAAMLEAGASVRSLGRVKWQHTDSGKPTGRPDNCLLFVLRPEAQAAHQA